jgi:hypothetical protein
VEQQRVHVALALSDDDLTGRTGGIQPPQAVQRRLRAGLPHELLAGCRDADADGEVGVAG